MTIEKAALNDLPDILELQYLAYQSEAEMLNNYNIPPLKQTLEEVTKEHESGIILKATNDDNQIVGSVRAYSNSETLFIGKLIVHPEMQGNGIGTLLLQSIENICPLPRYELFTSSKSARNITLYERLGYIQFKIQEIAPDLMFIYLEKKINL